VRSALLPQHGTPHPSRRQAQAAQTRQDVLVAARDTFPACGYAGTALAAVARAAGVVVETIYRASAVGPGCSGPSSRRRSRAASHGRSFLSSNARRSGQFSPRPTRVVSWRATPPSPVSTPGWARDRRLIDRRSACREWRRNVLLMRFGLGVPSQEEDVRG
jgi:hypothetical protein